ncbi:MAG: hypothetical protein N2746_09490 [Deltaproteobacteria bacterium]|nr:hypothetical protein [Deltaproteobacteria bacterium]
MDKQFLSLIFIVLGFVSCSDSSSVGNTSLPDVILDKGVTDIVPDIGEISENAITMLTEWDPGLPSTDLIEEVRGYKIARVIIHAHSVYSHDGCDGNSVENGNPEEDCVLQLRDAICKLNLNGIFMTDHAGSLADEEDFRKLYYPREGDTPVIENEIQTGNQINCPNGAKPVIMVGSENDIMPIGITAHPSSDINERKKIYGSVDESAIEAFRKVNGVVCTAHSEGKEDNYLIGSSLECMEIYNFHVSVLSSSGLVVLVDYMNQPERMPHPDLAFLAFYEPLKLQLNKWYTTVEKRNISPIIGTDIHRNAVKKVLSDGERLDSYRRFMRWFTNFLLVKDYKPSEFKKAIKDGRIYVVAEGLGTPSGFDFYAETKNGIVDTGKTIKKADFKKFVIKIPEVTGIENEDIYVKARLFKIKDKSEIEILKPIARSEKKIIEISEGIDVGVYAVQVLLTPMHLKRLCKRWASEYIKEFVWIYSNTIRVE